MAKRASNLEFDQRINAVYALILDGWTESRIVPQVTQQWDIKRRQAYNYIRRAQERIQEDYARHRENALAEHLMERRRLRREAADPLFKLTVLQDEAKLLGLYKERVELAGKDGGAIVINDNYTDEQRVRGLVSLFDAIRSRVPADDNGGQEPVDAAERTAMGGDPQSG